MTDDLKHLIKRAMLIKQHSLPKEGFDIDFTALLLAFLISKDTMSLWFREYVELASINLDEILASKRFDRRILLRKFRMRKSMSIHSNINQI